MWLQKVGTRQSRSGWHHGYESLILICSVHTLAGVFAEAAGDPTAKLPREEEDSAEGVVWQGLWLALVHQLT